MDQAIFNILFVIVASIVVVLLLLVRRYWASRLNMSQEDEALERRVTALNDEQAFRRRDDEIVRVLRGDEQPTVGKDEG